VAHPTLLDVVFFHLRGLRCALPCNVVRQMLPILGLTPVPLAPPVFRGITSVHGQVLPVLDLGVFFPQSGKSMPNGSTESYLAERCLLIETAPDTNTPAIAAALMVEPQVRMGSIDEQHSRPPPPRPSFVTATVFDAEGPALLISAPQAIDLVRSAISMVTNP